MEYYYVIWFNFLSILASDILFVSIYKKKVFHGIQKKFKKNVGLNKNFIKNIN